MALLTAMAQVRSPGWELPHVIGTAKKKKKLMGRGRYTMLTLILKIGEFLLGCNGIGGVLGALGCRFNPQPGTVGWGFGIATAAASVETVALI